MTKIKNIGPKSYALLEALGVCSIEKVKKLGWKKIMLLIAEYNPKYINANMAYALIGAIKGEHWLSLSEEEKKEVKTFINSIRE